MCARAVSADGELVGVSTQRFGLRVCPQERLVSIVARRGENVFRRFAIQHGEHRQACFLGQRSGECVVRIDAADHPAAAVVIDQQGQHVTFARRAILGSIEPRRQAAPR